MGRVTGKKQRGARNSSISHGYKRLSSKNKVLEASVVKWKAEAIEMKAKFTKLNAEKNCVDIQAVKWKAEAIEMKDKFTKSNAEKNCKSIECKYNELLLNNRGDYDTGLDNSDYNISSEFVKFVFSLGEDNYNASLLTQVKETFKDLERPGSSDGWWNCTYFHCITVFVRESLDKIISDFSKWENIKYAIEIFVALFMTGKSLDSSEPPNPAYFLFHVIHEEVLSKLFEQCKKEMGSLDAILNLILGGEAHRCDMQNVQWILFDDAEEWTWGWDDVDVPCCDFVNEDWGKTISNAGSIFFCKPQVAKRYLKEALQERNRGDIIINLFFGLDERSFDSLIEINKKYNNQFLDLLINDPDVLCLLREFVKDSQWANSVACQWLDRMLNDNTRLDCGGNSTVIATATSNHVGFFSDGIGFNTMLSEPPPENSATV